MPVQIKDLVDAMDMQIDEHRQYLNKETGVIVTVSTEELSIAEESEEGDDFSRYPEWQREFILAALGIIENGDKYVELPDKWEINEYNIMESFCDSVDNENISEALYVAIRGRGAFRRFKDAVIRYRIEKRWYSFREEVLRDIAIRWCEGNDIIYSITLKRKSNC
jgi:Uncharacterised protein family (UPF0158)